MHHKLYKTGQVTIPKKVQQQFDLKDGDFLYLYQQKGSIIVVKHHSDHTLNQSFFQNGRLYIPSELRRLLSFSPGIMIEMTITKSKDKLILKAVNESI